MNLARTGGKVGHWVLPDGYYRCHEHSYWRCRCDVHHTLNVFPGTVFSRLRGQPTATRITRWWHAMPQYSPGHVERVDALTATVARDVPGLWLAGAAYRGLGLPACIAQGRAAARAALATVGQA